MKFNFDDSSYIEFSVKADNKVMVTLAARDGNNHKNMIVNSAELNFEDFKKIFFAINSELSSSSSGNTSSDNKKYPDEG